MTKDNAIDWVKPLHMIKTSCARAYNSILDFAFVNAKVMKAKSDILMREKINCRDDENNPDHRPVELYFSL